MEHLAQVRLIAKRIHNRLPASMLLDDLISAGIVGLLAAVDNFDSSLHVQLKTYAEHRIRGAIMDSLRDMDWAPRDTRKRARQIEIAIHEQTQRLGREPSGEEIAAGLGITPAEYQEWLVQVQSVDLQRLEFAPGEAEDAGMLKFIADNDENWPSSVMERSELERIVALAVERMPKVERNVLSLYYFEEMSHREIAEIIGLHRTRVGQLRTQAILRLRSHLQRVWASPPRRKQWTAS